MRAKKKPVKRPRQRVIMHSMEWHRFRIYQKGYGVYVRHSYYLQPWRLVRDVASEVASILHRGLYGWDVTDTWAGDWYLATILPRMMRRIIDHGYGTPIRFVKDEGRTPPAPLAREDMEGDDIAFVVHSDDPNALDEGWDAYTAWLEEGAQACDNYIAMLEYEPPFEKWDKKAYASVKKRMVDIMRHIEDVSD